MKTIMQKLKSKHDKEALYYVYDAREESPDDPAGALIERKSHSVSREMRAFICICAFLIGYLETSSPWSLVGMVAGIMIISLFLWKSAAVEKALEIVESEQSERDATA